MILSLMSLISLIPTTNTLFLIFLHPKNLVEWRSKLHSGPSLPHEICQILLGQADTESRVVNHPIIIVGSSSSKSLLSTISTSVNNPIPQLLIGLFQIVVYHELVVASGLLRKLELFICLVQSFAYALVGFCFSPT